MRVQHRMHSTVMASGIIFKIKFLFCGKAICNNLKDSHVLNTVFLLRHLNVAWGDVIMNIKELNLP